MFVVFLPVFAFLFSKLFMLEVSKVQIDVMAAGAYLMGIVFILSTVVTLLGNDLGSKVCYFFLTPPIRRQDYLLGRFFGLVVVVTLLYIVLLIGVEGLVWYSLEYEDPFYRHGISWITGVMVAWTAWYQTLSLLSVIFMICTWASGVAEMLVFSSSAAFIYWVFPAILSAIQAKNDIDSIVSDKLANIIEMLAWLLPDMTGGSLVLAFEHGIAVDYQVVFMHAAGHLGYTIIMMLLAFLIFMRRDL
ncbi:MAG: hypothetical protein Q9M22_04695 [Mariprofundaceae bacterium]|nr:hypothetical protein [Mariprofundaceae bacterium]